MTYQIAFFDIDGTLADNEQPRELGLFQRIPESAKTALTKLQAKGIETVIATGRNHGTIKDLAAALNIDGIISSNGCQVTFHGKTLTQHPLSPVQVKEIIASLDQQKREFLIETAEKIYCYEDFHFQENPQHPYTFIKREAPLPENILQLILHDFSGVPISLALPGTIVEKVSPVAFNIHGVTISKASGILELLKYLGLSTEEAVAFGDEENDFAMFEVVGMPVAMGNANPLLKEKAKHITSKVGDDGIYQACLALGLIEA